MHDAESSPLPAARVAPSRKRSRIVLLIVLLGGGALLTAWQMHRVLLQNSAPAARLLTSREIESQLAWPLNRSWIWEITPPRDLPAHCGLSLVVRTVDKPLRDGENLAIGRQKISQQESVRDASFGRLSNWSGERGVVCAQCVDLNDIAAHASPLKSPLRLLLTLRLGGSSTFNFGERSIIDGSRVEGTHIDNEAQWEGRELHLMNLYTREGNRVFIYDLVLLAVEER